MKKELFAAALLTLILILSLLNTRAISQMCDEIRDSVRLSGTLAEAGDWQASAQAANRAISLWKRRGGYAKTVLRHTDIETLSDDLYELTEHIYTKDPGAVKSAVSLVSEHLSGISEMESLTFGSVF